MQSHEAWVEGLSRIIAEASKSNLGILALLIILVGVLAYVLFRGNLTPKNIRSLLICRTIAFVLIFSGACAFGWAVVRSVPPAAPPKAEPVSQLTPVPKPPRPPLPHETDFQERLALARQYADVGLSGQSANAFHQLAVPERYRGKVDNAALADAESAYRQSRFDDARRAFVTAFQRIKSE